MKKITIITGHYGSGKTNFSVNLAVKAAQEGETVTIVDLDIVNPYFRTADFKELFEEKGIRLVAPDYANTSLDLPSLQFDVVQLAMNSGKLIIDVGGDDAGAVALGRYAAQLEQFADETEMLCVINQRRTLTASANDAAVLIYEIEAASRMKHTGIVNNTNLGCETTAEIVEKSREFADEVCRLTNLPLFCTVYPEGCEASADDAFEAKVYVKPVWEL